MTRRELVKEVHNLCVQHAGTRIPLDDNLDILCILVWRSDDSVDLENVRIVLKGTKKVIGRIEIENGTAWNNLPYPPIREFRERIKRACAESDSQAKEAGQKKSEYFEDVLASAGVS